ncbi:MAG TPA: flagellar basal-body MS-ring/collar protein FliF [Stellaceae bacterium]|nr:flagellar basal-body MS-ring/collar protein FliF [Stellaceae bacterium]
MNGFFQLIRNLGPARLLTLALIMAGTIAFFYYLVNKVNTPEMGLLYSDLDLKDSGQIVQKLESLNVPYALRAQGSQILVPVDQATKLRMAMAEIGLPHGGSVGYEIFDKTDQFGPSQFVENINQVRALEGELERTITSINLVQSARVHLVLPQRQMFSRDRQEASASIVLKVRGKLSSGQVAAIQHLVAAAVPNLNPNHVSIVDDQGNLLARGDGDASTALTSSNAEEMRVNYESRMAHNVEQLLERSVGAGKARVDVHAEMNFDRVTTNSETYDPDGQVVRSTQTDNQSEQNGTSSGAAVSVSTNLPNGQTAPNNSGDNKQSKSTHTQETVNYEISKTVKSQVSDQGTVKRLSVAVLVDGTTSVGTDGKKTYQPRSPDELKQLTALVRSAVGYDAKRGDTVEVVNMPFAGAEEPPAAPAAFNIMGLEKGDLMYLGTTAGTALIGLLILMLVVKPMIGRFLDTAKTLGGNAMPALAVAGAPAAALPAPAAGNAVVRVPQSPQGEMIDIGQVEGRVAASSLKKIGEIVEKHPDEAVSIVRSWMYQDN